MTQKQPTQQERYEMPRKIFKFSDDLSQDLLEIIQESLIEEGSGDLTKQLLNYKCFQGEKEELIPGDNEINREWRVGFQPGVVEHLGTLLNFSLMTATNFIDLLRQVRVEMAKNMSVSLTPEYLEYFQGMVKARAELAKQMMLANNAGDASM